jgi:hypothetical protein
VRPPIGNELPASGPTFANNTFIVCKNYHAHLRSRTRVDCARSRTCTRVALRPTWCDGHIRARVAFPLSGHPWTQNSVIPCALANGEWSG